MKIFSSIIASVSPTTVYKMLIFMRVTIGLLTIGHGIPKIIGGVPMWHTLGEMMVGVGITFLPVMWGLLGACTEFFGGMLLMLGFGTRIASAALTIMMIIATAWHVHQGDSYNLYSFPLSLIVVFVVFMVVGGGPYSVDSLLNKRK